VVSPLASSRSPFLPRFPVGMPSFSRAAYFSVLKMEAAGTSETIVPSYQTTLHILEGSIL
jgi:hypothetical protein